MVIVGGSHSAFSAVWALAERLPRATFRDGDLVILHRSRLRIFYPSPGAAREDGYEEFDERDLCPRTGRVHRLGGLRGDGRELWRRVTGRASPHESRVRIVPLDEDRPLAPLVRDLLREADLIVPAFGYRPRSLPVHDAEGRRIELACDVGRPVAGLTAIGMAAGFLPPGEPSFGGQTNGAWLYHNVAGDAVLRTLAGAPQT